MCGLYEGVIPSIVEKITKPKKTRAPRQPRGEPLHPSYFQMIAEALIALKDRSGSSQYAIARYIEAKYKHVLPANFRKTLSVQLRNLVKQHKLVKVKSSYKLSEEGKRAVAPKTAKKAVVAKPVKIKATPRKGLSPRTKKTTTRTAKPKSLVPTKRTAATHRTVPAKKRATTTRAVPAKKHGATRTTPVKRRGPRKTTAKSPVAKVETAAKRAVRKATKAVKGKSPAKSPRARKPAAKRVKKV